MKRRWTLSLCKVLVFVSAMIPASWLLGDDAPSFVAQRNGSTLRFEIEAKGPMHWRVVGARGQDCAEGRVGAGKQAVVLDKIASNEDVRVIWRDAAGIKQGEKKIPGNPELSPLKKVRGNTLIYQLAVRTYTARGLGKELTGKFDAVDDTLLRQIKELGTDYLWLTGVLEQATPQTVDPDAVKGEAGSYYAIRDMWDAASELGGISALEALIARAHRHGLRVIIDLIPNHTSRAHQTDVLCKTDLNFGSQDRTDRFFDTQNNYYYLQGKTFTPPMQPNVAGTDGVFDMDLSQEGIQFEAPAKVTGNDVLSERPSIDDWFETVKLNYGYDLSTDTLHVEPRPRTWMQILDVARYWLEKGVDGFRLDFAHVVPMEFWHWFLAEVKRVQPEAYLVAEAYESENSGFSYEMLYAAGIDSVYHSELYWKMHHAARSGLDIREANPLRMPSMRQESVRAGRNFTNYMENHDEIRVASKLFANLPFAERAELGLAFSGYLALLPGNFLIHGGQEFREDASIVGPFAPFNGRTSIFDFVYQKATRAWIEGVAGDETARFRERYKRLFHLKKQLPFSAVHRMDRLSFYDLAATNFSKPQSAWVASYLRVDRQSGKRFLVVLNSHQTRSVDTTIHFTDETGHDSYGILRALGIEANSTRYRFTERFAQPGFIPHDPNVDGDGVPGSVLFKAGGIPSGLYLGLMPPRTLWVFEIE